MNQSNVLVVAIMLIFLASLHGLLFKFQKNINEYAQDLHNQDRRFIKNHEYAQKNFYILEAKNVGEEVWDVEYQDLSEALLLDGQENPRNWLYFKIIWKLNGIPLSKLYETDSVNIYSVNKNIFFVSNIPDSSESSTQAFQALYNQTREICITDGDMILKCRAIQPRNPNI